MKSANLALSFLLELAMVVALGYFGFHFDGPTWLKWVIGIGLPLVVIVFWGIFMAPQAANRLPWPIVPIIALILFLGSSVLLYTTGSKTFALAMALASIVSAALTFMWHQY